MLVQQLRSKIPWLMAALRALLSPAVILMQQAGWSGASLAAAVLYALLSDIFDGILARRWHTDTPALRLFDSVADTLFYAGIGIALWLRHPALVRSLGWAFATVAALEITRWSLECVRCGKPASYHTRLAKLWGLALANAAFFGFLTNNPYALSRTWTLALFVGIACDTEGLAMSLILPLWRRDVLDLSRAWEIRRQLRSKRPSSPAQALKLAEPLTRRTSVCLLAIALLFSLRASAEPIRPAVWVTGSSTAIASGTAGQLDIAAPDKLTFRSATGVEFAIPYTDIQHFDYKREVRHQLGILPAIAVGLLAARQHRHLVTISYTDPASQAKQAVILDLPKDGASLLLTVLRSRTTACAPQANQTCGFHVQ